MRGVLFSDSVRINDAISVRIPLVGDVWENEDDYFAAVSSIISTPYDMMVQLDDNGIDFSKLDKFELFCMLFGGLQKMDTKLIFGELDLTKFSLAKNTKSNELVLYDSGHGIAIDKAVHEQVSSTLRRILQIKQNDKKPGNEEGRKYMIRVARMKLKRQMRLAKSKESTQLEDIIVSLVNTGEFPYDYETVKKISIYQLYLSLNQIQHKIQFDNTMGGVYAGTVKFEDLISENRTWIKT
jgi:hypothetical protein